jgi:hypothetical protein
MPTTPVTIQIEKISQYLVSNEIAKGSLFGQKLNPNWDVILYMERMGLSWALSQSSTYEDIYAATQYNYWLCYKTNKASYILANGSGGTIAPVVPIDDCCLSIYPIYITAADLDEDGNYNNSNIVGDNVIVFFNSNNQNFLTAGSGFEYTTTGIQITMEYDETYSWVIQKLGSSDSAPIDTPNVYNYNLIADATLIENVIATTDGQIVTIAIKPNGFTYTWDTFFVFNDNMPEQPGAIGVNTVQLYTFQYISAINKLVCVAQGLNTPY